MLTNTNNESRMSTRPLPSFEARKLVVFHASFKHQVKSKVKKSTCRTTAEISIALTMTMMVTPSFMSMDLVRIMAGQTPKPDSAFILDRTIHCKYNFRAHYLEIESTFHRPYSRKISIYFCCLGIAMDQSRAVPQIMPVRFKLPLSQSIWLVSMASNIYASEPIPNFWWIPCCVGWLDGNGMTGSSLMAIRLRIEMISVDWTMQSIVITSNWSGNVCPAMLVFLATNVLIDWPNVALQVTVINGVNTYITEVHFYFISERTRIRKMRSQEKMNENFSRQRQKCTIHWWMIKWQ